MEPERLIEKFLRAFAKKRGEQAGDPFELHPVARQQLQKEIARRTAATSNSGGGWFLSFLPALRPRLAFALCFIALAVAGLILWPNFTARKPATLASANLSRKEMAPEKKAEPAFAPPQIAPVTLAADGAARADRDKRPVVTGNTAIKSRSPTVVIRQPMVPPPDETKQAVMLQNKMAQTPVPTSVAAAATGSFGGASVADARVLSKDAVSPAPTGVTFFGNSKTQVVAATLPASQVFNRLDLPAGGRRAIGGSIASAPVLASFRVEQTGNILRVVDVDGSVYTGAVQMAQPVPAARAAVPKNAPVVASVTVTASPTPAARNYYFRVAGTNRNLNQNVIFSGNLIPLTNAPILTGAIGARRALDLPVESLLSNSRISGKATIGDQKEIEVNATPAP